MSKGQAIVKPVDVRKFAQQLSAFTADLNASTSRLQWQFRQLGETWRDQEHQRFENEFEQATRVFSKFAADANRYVTYLKRKADAAERYLQQR